MLKKILHSLIITVSFSCVLLFAGCIKFENSFDLLVSQPPQGSDFASETQQFAPGYNEASNEATKDDETVSSEASTAEPTYETETSTAPEETEESTSQAENVPENNEYDILRTGEFSFNGIITTDGEGMEVDMSIGNGKIYFTSDIDGLEIGLYIESNKTYIYAPSHKKYLKMNTAVAKLLQMDPETFVEMATELGFDKLPPLSSATSVESGSLNGSSCKIYTFSTGDNTRLCVYLNGEKLLKLEYVDKNGNTTNHITFNSVSAGFPKMPPDGFEEMGYLEFFRLIAGDI